MEIAAKMAMQYWSNIGEPRTKIASLKGGYHGDTFVHEICFFFAPYRQNWMYRFHQKYLHLQYAMSV